MSNADFDRRLAYLESRLARAEREIAMRAIKPTKGAAAATYQLLIDRGNTLNDGATLGIKFASSISTVPSVYDPNVTSSFIDGIGRATLYTNGVAGTGFVLVVNDGRAGSGISDALVQGDAPIATATPVTIPLAGDPTQSVTCYVPSFV